MFVVTACRGTAPKDASPASPPAPAKPAKSLPKIVAFGDSLTAGLGLPQSASYPSLLQKKLDADGYAYEVVNAGVSGDTSAGGVRRIDWALEQPACNFVLHTAPLSGEADSAFHWHLEILPRVTRFSGLEWGSGMWRNPVSPEEATQVLRGSAASS